LNNHKSPIDTNKPPTSNHKSPADTDTTLMNNHKSPIEIDKTGEMSTFKFFTEKSQIGYFRFILEGYDGLGIQSTLPGSTLITWTVPKSRHNEAQSLLEHLLSN
jgi:Domain of unknown function (DUF4911)